LTAAEGVNTKGRASQAGPDDPSPAEANLLVRPSTARYFNEALARGLSILVQFNERDQWLSLSEIARRTSMNRVTALRMVATLQALGFLDRSEATRKYRPGVATLTLGYAALRSFGIRDLALPFLERLAKQTNETVNMGVLIGAEVLYLERLKRSELVTADIHVGSRLPAHATSIGKLLLAFLPEKGLDELLLRMKLRKYGPNTITSKTRLKTALAKIRTEGYSVQDEEMAAGLRSVAAPIRDADGRVVAGINIAVPAARVSAEDLRDQLRLEVVVIANLISRAAGYAAIQPVSNAYGA
jgi:IclR family pca regulon transcriptional regulator